MTAETINKQTSEDFDLERVMEPRDRLAIGRELLQIAATEARHKAEFDAAAADLEEQRAKLAPRKVELEQLLEHFARTNREATGENSVVIPGVGEWSTRKAGGRFVVDDKAALIEALEGDEAGEFTYMPDPVPPQRQLRGDEVRARLLSMHREATDALPKDADEQRAAIGAGIAKGYPGMRFDEDRVNVSYKLRAASNGAGS